MMEKVVKCGVFRAKVATWSVMTVFAVLLPAMAMATGSFVNGSSQSFEVKANSGAITVSVSGFSNSAYCWKLDGGSTSIATAAFTGSAIWNGIKNIEIEGKTSINAASSYRTIACPSSVKITPKAVGTTTWKLSGVSYRGSSKGSATLTIVVMPSVTKLTATVNVSGNWSDSIWFQDEAGSAGAWQDGLKVEMTVSGSCVTQTVSSVATATDIKLLGSGNLTLTHAENLVFNSFSIADYTGHLTVDLSAEGKSMASWTELAASSSDKVTIIYNEKGGALRISEICPKPFGKDPNGVESAWVELENRGIGWVNMNGYELQRYNRGKEWKSGKFANLPSRMVPPGGRVLVYMSEGYTAGDDLAFAEEKIAEKGVGIYGDIIIVGAKISPKKYPVIRLLKGKDGKKKTEVIDTVTIPADIDDGISIVVTDPDTVSKGATRRYLTAMPTPGNENATSDVVAIGPEVGPLYEGLADDHDYSEFGPTVPAKAGSDYQVTLDVNPVAGGNASDAIKSVTLIYRAYLDTSYSVSMVSNEWVAGHGIRWVALIPSSKLPSAGRLVQWRAQIEDVAGNVWTSPSCNNPEDGCEWFGTIVEPNDSQMSQNGLDTFHIFADSEVADTPGVNNTTCAMNIDVANLDTTKYPYGARVAIYDSSTSNYYDNVRIDLRGHTTGDSRKRSHGLKFGKTHPLKLARPISNVVNGKKVTVKEVRKTSFIAEFADPSYVRQQTAFWLLNQGGSPAPFDYPVRLNLNGSFYQLAFHSARFSDELIEDVYGMDGRGAAFKNVGQFTCTSGSTTGTTAGGIERKTPDDKDETNVAEVNELATELKSAGVGNVQRSDDGSNTAGLNNSTLTELVVKKFDLAAWINYLALTRITQEMDDVWANLSAYYDDVTLVDGTKCGTGTWRPMAYDMNLSFGQWYYNDATIFGRVYMANQDNFKSHPFYGGQRIFAYNKKDNSGKDVYFTSRGNNAFEAVFQSAKFRRLYVRRLRTVMDKYLKAPGTAKENSPIWLKMQELVTMMGGTSSNGDAVRDRSCWKYLGTSAAEGAPEINIWGEEAAQPQNAQIGIEEIWNKYIVPRRQHLYETHTKSNDSNTTGYGANVSAGIPNEQSTISILKAGISATYDQSIGAVVIRNTNAETIDISGWKLTGPINMTIPAGTVLDYAQSGDGAVYVTTNRRETISRMVVNDQVVVGNGEAGSAVQSIALATDSGEMVISAASIGGKEYATEQEAVDAATSETPIEFAKTPSVDNENHTITTQNGEKIKVAEYYDAKVSGNVVTLSLNDAAKPEIMPGTRVDEKEGKEQEIPAFDASVGEDGTEVGVGTLTKKGLYYTLQVGSSIHGLAVPSGATWVQGDGGVIQLKTAKENGATSGFYRVFVTDVPDR